ncbi:MAG: hypothetical protein WAJ84_05030, partial [Candidatus Rhabdochlamydia sp.]
DHLNQSEPIKFSLTCLIFFNPCWQQIQSPRNVVYKWALYLFSSGRTLSFFHEVEIEMNFLVL